MKKYNKIYADMKDALSRKTGVAIPEGGDMAIRLSAVAAELESLWAQVDWTKRQCFPQYAAGEFLEIHAQMRGLSRGAASKAQGALRFETSEAHMQAVVIPAGTVCLNAAGAEFLTKERAEIAAGSFYCIAQAEAREPGAAGNVPAESVVFMTLAPVGISKCFNPDAFDGGTDGEGDEALRARVIESFKSLPNGSNRSYYETVALETYGVAAAVAIAKVRGLGTVNLYVAGEAGLPDAATVSAVKNRLEAEREICVDIEVSAPETVTVAVTVAIDVSENAETDTVLTAVRAAIEGYFNGKLLGKNILLAKLGAVVFGVEGVENFRITAPAADVFTNANQLPVAGTITVSER